jgi:biotin operon repressor
MAMSERRFLGRGGAAAEMALRVLRLADVGEWTPAAHIAARIGCSSQSVSHIVAALIRAGHAIEHGYEGYRLLERREAARRA